jgi:hypothetical protein
VRLSWTLLLVAAACRYDTSGVTVVGDGAIIDSGVVDVPGPDAAPCTGTAKSCASATQLTACIEGFRHDTDCAFGCLPTPEAHCAAPVISNDLDLAWLSGATADLAVQGSKVLVFDTTTGTVSECGGAMLHTAAQGIENGINYQEHDGIGVWSFDSLHVAAAGIVRVIGDKPAAFLVNADVRLEGIVDVSGGANACSLAAACGVPTLRNCGGPGGGEGGKHDEDGHGDGKGQKGESGGAEVDETGGGGAGFGAVGGVGGIGLVNAVAKAAPGGVVYGTAELVPLEGGSGGGGGGEATASGGLGGGGGGALQISALDRIEINAPVGSLRAAGAGGGAGKGSSGNGGGGGGSGGALLLEAPRVKVSGTLAANGGGGGGAGSDAATAGANGGTGTTQANGGTGLRPGGKGGALAVPAGSAGSPTVTPADGTGGGGGGVGRIFLRARPGELDVSGGTVSPAAGQGEFVLQ